ncbi:acyltransferase family protein [Neorhizobium petrolearium]|uniref:Acyltransferase n=1 Tax=Neorhizobium petrolearium TaxID=515361 RepID=A0ABY8M2M2_9HYPH|nr:acyltransferase [Neorhizobium petrolearium]MCC2608339.1 acyltransferase [Neorhizobium petrolearium]WGI68618.1 acyltransferase [Neorhizobium petrolearium]
MKYRPEIDGLRAIAVVSVILAHAGLRLTTGGFIGVDVFFVISGYLITKIIHDDLTNGKFSLWKFYERRARRILPALLVVLAASSVFAWMWMLPDYLENFGQSVVATLLFSNNILLALTSGYWELESYFKPLLHTWSLGVEEQFYIAFPLLMFLLRKQTKQVILGFFCILALASIAFAQVGSVQFPSGNFYLPFGRAWELLLGSICALTPLRPRRHDGLLAFVGLALVLGSVVFFDEKLPTPSVFLLPPVVGAVLIILFANGQNRVGQLLSTKAFVMIGLISYSAYLWHQPIFAFARIRSLDPPSPALMAALTLSIFPVAWLSWRFIELPFRKPALLKVRPFTAICTAAAALMVTFGLYLHATQGRPDRLFPNAKQGDLYIAYNERIRTYTADTFPANAQENVLVIGDSFARDVANALFEGGFLASRNLVYREDLPAYCRQGEMQSQVHDALFQQADYIVLTGIDDCASLLVSRAKQLERRALVIGPKHFGYNLNPFIGTPIEKRAYALTTPIESVRVQNETLRRQLPPENYFDLLASLEGNRGGLPVFDDRGQMISQDRMHFTKFGAIYAAPMIVSAVRSISP